MKQGTVLVIGNSGVGKSTLINAVLGHDVAKTDVGTKGTTTRLEIYESDQVPFRIIDSVGFEPSPIKTRAAIHAVKKWCKNALKNEGENTNINAIWVCVDGSAGKFFPETIKNISKALALLKSIPVIVVITKSVSLPDREKNIQTIKTAFELVKDAPKDIKAIIPVVASPYIIDDTTYVPPIGITELIDCTNEQMPDGIRIMEEELNKFKLNRKRFLAQSIVAAATAAGATVGAIPIPFADAVILVPIETTEINALAAVYGIPKNEQSKVFIASIVEVGTVSVAAKAAISGLKAIPGLHLATVPLNVAIAAAFVAAIGEGSVFAFEQIYMGKKSLLDIEWVKSVIESKLANELLEKVTAWVQKDKGSDGELKEAKKEKALHSGKK